MAARDRPLRHGHDGRPPRSRRPRAVTLVAAAAAVVLAAAAGGYLLRGGDDGNGGGATVAAPTVTDLTLPPGDVMQSCIAFSVETLAPMPVAFGGEVVEKTDGEILVDVETWYRGGDSDQVRLTAPDMSMTSLGGSIDFQVGSRYLLTAADGTVNYCGFSGPWTQGMADAFAAAFGSAVARWAAAHLEVHAGDGVVELAHPQRDLNLPDAVAWDDHASLVGARIDPGERYVARELAAGEPHPRRFGALGRLAGGVTEPQRQVFMPTVAGEMVIRASRSPRPVRTVSARPAPPGRRGSRGGLFWTRKPVTSRTATSSHGLDTRGARQRCGQWRPGRGSRPRR